MGKPAVFWDRDDTLIADSGYIDDPGKVKLLSGTIESLKKISKAGFENIVITNQSGIARGLFDEDTLQAIHDRLQQLLGEQGTCLDAIYYCPYLDSDEAVVKSYRRESDLRKPKPGMFLQASLERGIDLAASWAIGDSPRDSQAGRAAGCRTILIQRHNDTNAVSNKNHNTDFVVDSIEQAVEIVLKHTEKKTTSNTEADRTDEPAVVLKEILNFLRMTDRRSQREDFSLSRLAGTVTQMTAIGAMLYALFGWLMATESMLGTHMIRLQIALFLQTMALTFFVISFRSKP